MHNKMDWPLALLLLAAVTGATLWMQTQRSAQRQEQRPPPTAVAEGLHLLVLQPQGTLRLAIFAAEAKLDLRSKSATFRGLTIVDIRQTGPTSRETPSFTKATFKEGSIRDFSSIFDL